MVFPRDKSMSSIEQLKSDYGWVIRTAHRALRRWTTSGADVARVLDVEPMLFLHRFNPANLEHAPGLWLFLATVEYTKSREMAGAVAALADCIAVPDRAHDRHRGEAQLCSDVCADLAEVEGLIHRAVINRGAESREAARQALLKLVADAHLLAQRLAGRPA